jgi:hypothetical protein
MIEEKSRFGIGMSDDAKIKVDIEGFALYLSGREEALADMLEKLMEHTDLSDEKLQFLTGFNLEYIKNTRLELPTK